MVINISKFEYTIVKSHYKPNYKGWTLIYQKSEFDEAPPAGRHMITWLESILVGNGRNLNKKDMLNIILDEFRIYCTFKKVNSPIPFEIEILDDLKTLRRDNKRICLTFYRDKGSKRPFALFFSPLSKYEEPRNLSRDKKTRKYDPFLEKYIEVEPTNKSCEVLKERIEEVLTKSLQGYKSESK